MILYRVAGYGFGIAVVCCNILYRFINLYDSFSSSFHSPAVEIIHILQTEILQLLSVMFLKVDQLKIDYSKILITSLIATSINQLSFQSF